MDEVEKQELKDALHKMNNALNSIAMQAELAKLYIDRNDAEKVKEALDTVMAQCRQCSAITRNTQSFFDNGSGGC